MTPHRVDEALRRALTPPADAAARVAAVALQRPTRRPHRRALALVAATLAVALLVAVVALRRAPRPAGRAASMFSVGTLVVATPARGSAWVVGPGTDPAATQPNLIVTEGAPR